jgi:DNA-binding MarR family transcriptional regulator
MAGSAGDDTAAAVRAVAFTARKLERELGEMTLPQFRVLTLVASSVERANRIAELAAVSRPSLTGLLDGLEARGWVRRVDVVGDRRGVLLEVTDAGQRALASAEQAMARSLDELLDIVPTDQRGQALQGLAVLGHALRTPRDTAGAPSGSGPR